LTLQERQNAEDTTQAARWGLTLEEYRKQRERCREGCHPQTCNHPWSK